jgi:hypothetical protein
VTPCLAAKSDACDQGSLEHVELLFVTGDSWCLLDEGHPGEHEWTPTSELAVRVVE